MQPSYGLSWCSLNSKQQPLETLQARQDLICYRVVSLGGFRTPLTYVCQDSNPRTRTRSVDLVAKPTPASKCWKLVGVEITNGTEEYEAIIRTGRCFSNDQIFVWNSRQNLPLLFVAAKMKFSPWHQILVIRTFLFLISSNELKGNGRRLIICLIDNLSSEHLAQQIIGNTDNRLYRHILWQVRSNRSHSNFGHSVFRSPNAFTFCEIAHFVILLTTVEKNCT